MHTEAVSTFEPSANSLTLQNGKKLTYDFLVVAAGLKVDWGKIQVMPLDPPAHTLHESSTTFAFMHVMSSALARSRSLRSPTSLRRPRCR